MHQSSTNSHIECYVVLNFVVFLIECLEIIFKIWHLLLSWRCHYFPKIHIQYKNSIYVHGQHSINIVECCWVLWNSAECHRMHRSSTNSIIVICTRYKYYVLEEESNAFILASFLVRWNGITQHKWKLYVNFVSLGRYCIISTLFFTGKNTTFVDNTAMISSWQVFELGEMV
jgi:hypothetical protein